MERAKAGDTIAIMLAGVRKGQINPGALLVAAKHGRAPERVQPRTDRE